MGLRGLALANCLLAYSWPGLCNERVAGGGRTLKMRPGLRSDMNAASAIK